MSIDFPVRNRVPAVSGLSNGVFAVMVMLAFRHLVLWPLWPMVGTAQKKEVARPVCLSTVVLQPGSGFDPLAFGCLARIAWNGPHCDTFL